MTDQRRFPVPAPPHLRPTSGQSPRWDRGTLQTALLSIIAGVLAVAALESASFIAIPVVLALLCAIALAPAIQWMERSGAPPTLCAAIVVGGLLGLVVTTVYLLMPSAEAMNERAPQILREVETRLRRIVSELSPTSDGDTGVPDSPGPSEPPAGDTEDEPASEAEDDAVGRLVEGGQNLMASWAIGAPGVIAGAVFWAMLTFYMLRDRAMLARVGMAIFSDGSTRRAIGRAMRDVQSNVARYLLAISAVNLGLGISVAIAFQVLGVANAPIWGAAAGLLNFMPFIGIALFALITLGLGIASDQVPIIAFAPFAAVVALNVIEGHIITPMVVGARIRIAPIAVFAMIFFGAWLWGPAGALVATPTLIVAVAFVQRLNTGRRPPLAASH